VNVRRARQEETPECGLSHEARISTARGAGVNG
jgi:hypothetical protein